MNDERGTMCKWESLRAGWACPCGGRGFRRASKSKTLAGIAPTFRVGGGSSAEIPLLRQDPLPDASYRPHSAARLKHFSVSIGIRAAKPEMEPPVF